MPSLLLRCYRAILVGNSAYQVVDLLSLEMNQPRHNGTQAEFYYPIDAHLSHQNLRLLQVSPKQSYELNTDRYNLKPSYLLTLESVAASRRFPVYTMIS